MQSFLGDQKLVNLPRISLQTFLPTPRRAAVALFCRTNVGVNESRGCKRRSLFHVSLFFLPASFQCCFFPSSFSSFFHTVISSFQSSLSLPFKLMMKPARGTKVSGARWRRARMFHKFFTLQFSWKFFFIFSKVFLCTSFFSAKKNLDASVWRDVVTTSMVDVWFKDERSDES